MKQTVRTFIAVETSHAVCGRAAELIQTLQTAGVQVSWIKPHNLHLTLKFLDEVPLELIPELSDAVRTVAVAYQPLELEIRGAGAFPSVGRPRTLWLGGEGSEPLGKLQAALEKSLARLGFRKEPRRFAPHLTLGRVRGVGPGLGQLSELLRQHADFNAGRFEISELVIFSSQLTPQGPIYDVLGRAELAKSA